MEKNKQKKYWVHDNNETSTTTSLLHVHQALLFINAHVAGCMCELTCHSYKIINYYGGVGIHAEYILNSCLTNMYIRYIEGAEKF